MEPWSQVSRDFGNVENSTGMRAATGTPFQYEHNGRFLLLFGETKRRGLLLTRGTVGLQQIDVSAWSEIKRNPGRPLRSKLWQVIELANL